MRPATKSRLKKQCEVCPTSSILHSAHANSRVEIAIKQNNTERLDLKLTPGGIVHKVEVALSMNCCSDSIGEKRQSGR